MDNVQEVIDTIRKIDPDEIDIAFILKTMQHVLEYEDFISAGKVIFYVCNQLIGSTSGYVALLNEEKDNNRVLFLEPGNNVCRVSTTLPMPIRGFRAKVYSTKKTHYDNNFEQSPHLQLLPKGHINLKNVLFAPLIIDDQVVGLLGLGNKPAGFTDKDAELATSFASLASIALKNRRRLEKLRDSEAEKQSLNKQKDRFFSIVSHDLRSQFHNIRALSGILDKRFDKLPDDKKVYFIGELNKAVNITSKLFENMLLWSKIQLQNLKVKKSLINFSELLKDTVRQLEDSAFKKNISMQYTIDSNIEILADEFQISTTLRNLISNAIKFTPTGGTIEVTLAVRNNEAHLSIKDTGVGIAPEKLDTLFNHDSIFSTTGTGGEAGTGLGLILCKEFTDLNDGIIHVESQQNRGTTFKLIFPICNN